MTSRKTNQKQKNDILVNNKLIKYGEIHTEICMQVKKQQLELDMEQQTGSKSGKGVRQGCILSPCLFNLYAEFIMRNAGLEEA